MATAAESMLVDILHKRDLGATASGDLARIDGLANFQNALFHRLITSPGSLVHKPGYGVGIKDFQNKLNTLARQRVLAGRIDEQFSQDPRVEKVLGVLVDYDQANPSKVTITVRVKALGFDDLALKFTPFKEA